MRLLETNFLSYFPHKKEKFTFHIILKNVVVWLDAFTIMLCSKVFFSTPTERIKEKLYVDKVAIK
jgi:hypothetical protein